MESNEELTTTRWVVRVRLTRAANNLTKKFLRARTIKKVGEGGDRCALGSACLTRRPSWRGGTWHRSCFRRLLLVHGCTARRQPKRECARAVPQHEPPTSRAHWRAPSSRACFFFPSARQPFCGCAGRRAFHPSDVHAPLLRNLSSLTRRRESFLRWPALWLFESGCHWLGGVCAGCARLSAIGFVHCSSVAGGRRGWRFFGRKVGSHVSSQWNGSRGAAGGAVLALPGRCHAQPERV